MDGSILLTSIAQLLYAYRTVIIGSLPMPRPKKNEGQRLDAYFMYKQRFGPTKIREGLTVRFDAGEYGGHEDLVHLNSVKNWLREFRESDRGFDDPFEWHQLAKYDLPWEASEFLLEMWAYVKELNADLAWALQYSASVPPPTVRQAHWWWRVHQAAPSKDKEFIRVVADQLWISELHKDVLGRTVDVSGIEAYLAYREWVSPKHKTDYLQAIKDGRIPPLHNISVNSARLGALRGHPDLSIYFPKPGERVADELGITQENEQ